MPKGAALKRVSWDAASGNLLIVIGDGETVQHDMKLNNFTLAQKTEVIAASDGDYDYNEFTINLKVSCRTKKP